MKLNDLIDLTNVRGYYTGSFESESVAAGATTDTEIFHFRWFPSSIPTALCLVTKVRIQPVIWTSFGTSPGQGNQFALFRASGWLTKTGVGNAITLGATCKRDSAFPSSLMAAGDITINTTLNTGIKGVSSATLDAHAISRAAWPTGAVSTPVSAMDLVDVSKGSMPIILRGATAATAEGLVIVAPDIDDTGVWRFVVDVEWIETLGDEG